MGMIADLYYGELSPFENMGYSDSEGYKELVDDIERLEKMLFEKLSDEEKNLYINLTAARTTRENMELGRTFINAFRLGALLLIDVCIE